MNILVAIGGLAFLILIHEAGHFFTALAVKMRPRRFYIFFPPAIVKWQRKGIEYGIGAIPLGGYVKIPGMHKPAGADLEGAVQPGDRRGAVARDASRAGGDCARRGEAPGRAERARRSPRRGRALRL